MPTLPINGIEICLEDWGDPDDEPILLIMGLGAQLITWPAGFCSALLARDRRVIRFDNRDAGLSTKTPGPSPSAFDLLAAAMAGEPVQAPYSLSDMADDAVGVLDAVGLESAHIVGASLGGMIAQTVAIDHPSRTRSLTSIMSTTGDPTVGAPTPEAMAILTQAQPADRDGAIAVNVKAAEVVGGPHFDIGEATSRLAESYDRNFHPMGTAFQIAAIAASGDRTEALAALDIPTLVVHGRKDPLIALSGGEATAAVIPGAELLVLDDMAHDLPSVHWDIIAGAIVRLAG